MGPFVPNRHEIGALKVASALPWEGGMVTEVTNQISILKGNVFKKGLLLFAMSFTTESAHSRTNILLFTSG